MYPDSSVASEIYPVLVLKKHILLQHLQFTQNAAAKNIYYYPRNATYNDLKTSVGVIDDTKRVIFLSFPLDKMNAGNSSSGVIGFFKQAFSDFGIALQ